MELIFFTKFLKSLNPQQIGEAAKRIGVDGVDLAVRDGYAVNPSNVSTALAPAMRTWRSQGVTVPMVTLEGGATDPSDPTLIAIFEACGAEGIGLIKLGYWHWGGSQPYWEGVASIRRALEGFTKLGERTGVCSLIHTHSGSCFGLNASAAMHLAHDFDPKHVGVYLDPGHLALCGEPLPMALAMVGSHLKMVGAKNARHERADGGKWRTVWTTLADGLVDWGGAVQTFARSGFEGPFSVHGEYSVTEETEGVLRLAAEDVALLRAAAG